MLEFFFGLAALWLASVIMARVAAREKGWYLDLLATGSYIPAVLGFFWQLVFIPGVMVPKTGGDLASFLYPMFHFAARQWQQGVVPLWNPHLYGGAPFIADMQTGSFYPPNLLAILLAHPLTYEVMELMAVVHYFLAAVFTYAYARTLGLGRLAAFGAGLVFAFSGFMTAHLVHLNMIEAAAWIPLVLACFHRSLYGGGWPWSLGAGAAFGISVLAGHCQISLYLVLFLGLYWLYWLWIAGALEAARPSRLMRALWAASVLLPPPAALKPVWDWAGQKSAGLILLPPAGLPARPVARPARSPVSEEAGLGRLAKPPWRKGTPWAELSSLPLTLLVAAGIGAVLLMPAAELVPLSIRASLSYEKATDFAASPGTLVALLVPHFLGNGPVATWGPHSNLTEVYGYAGLFPLVLAIAALFLSRRLPLWAVFFAASSVLFLVLSMGDSTVLYGWLYRFVPGFDKVRSAGRFLLFFDLGVAVLAGFGLETLREPLASRARPAWRLLVRLIIIVLGAAALIAVPLLYFVLLVSQRSRDDSIATAVQQAQESLLFSLVVLSFSLAILLAWRYRPRLREWLLALSLALVVLDLFSANASHNPTTEDFLSGYDHPEVLSLLRQEQEPYRLDAKSQIEDAWGYAGNAWQLNLTLIQGIDDVTGMHNPMTLADYRRYWENLGTRKLPAYDLLNAKYLVASKDMMLEPEKFELVSRDDPSVDIYRNRNALPRALLVPSATVLPREHMLARLRSPEFDPRGEVFLEGGQAMQGSSPAGEVLGLSWPDTNQMVVEADAIAPAYLLLSEAWYPGWKAYVDGMEQPIHRANYIFRAVRLEPGRHTVRFAYQPWYWPLALWITLGSLAVVMVTVGYIAWKSALVPRPAGFQPADHHRPGDAWEDGSLASFPLTEKQREAG